MVVWGAWDVNSAGQRSPNEGGGGGEGEGLLIAAGGGGRVIAGFGSGPHQAAGPFDHEFFGDYLRVACLFFFETPWK